MPRVVAKTCSMPCTKVVKLVTDHELPANAGISLPPYTEVDGYRHINIFVTFAQEQADEPPVDLGVMFAFDANGAMGAFEPFTSVFGADFYRLPLNECTSTYTRASWRVPDDYHGTVPLAAGETLAWKHAPQPDDAA